MNRFDPVQCRSDLRRVADVQRQRVRLSVLGAYLLHGLVRARGIHVGAVHERAEGGQCARRGLANAAARTHHQRRPPVQPEHRTIINHNRHNLL